jgi:hypothetical protein
MDTLWIALKTTPLWVYVLFFYLLFIGMKATKTNSVPMGKLAVLPIIFFVLSIHTLIAQLQVNLVTVSAYILSIGLGTWGGWLLVRNIAIGYDKTTKLLTLPGSWVTPVLILLIFFSKYYFGFELSMYPSKAESTEFDLAFLGVSGVCTGLFIGRLLGYYLKIKDKTA